MIDKQFTPKRTICRVTFRVPRSWANRKVSLVGDFNEWDPEKHRLQEQEGYWQTLVRLKPDRKYKFKYLLDGEIWQNDDQADDYVINPFGTEDSILEIGQ